MVQQIRSVDYQFMLEALKEGKKALPICLPNPPVGAIIVSDNQIIAKGYTQEPGKNHAEVMVLEQLNDNHKPEDCSLYVTLEPCCFVGKTPACSLRIINSGIKKVYIGIIDPDPRNNGKGIQQLQDAGIKVELGVASEECLEFLSDYLLA